MLLSCRGRLEQRVVWSCARPRVSSRCRGRARAARVIVRVCRAESDVVGCGPVVRSCRADVVGCGPPAGLTAGQGSS